MSENVSFLAQGRIVYVIGDLFKGDVAMNYGTKNPKLNKQGQQYREYGLGLAISKTIINDPNQCVPGGGAEIWLRMHEAAYKLFPNRQIPPGFHMKYKDGDTGVNQDGSPVNTKAGYPGHIVFSLKSTFPMRFFRLENGHNIEVNEGIKCGDYVNVQLTVNAHAGVNAGLYLNPLGVQFLGYGEEIISAPSANQIFGTKLPPLPPGASATPIAPKGAFMPQQPQQMMYPGTPQPAPQQFQPQQAAPHFGVLPQQFQPAPTPQQFQPAPQQTTGGMPPLPFVR